eukprot:sb/3462977/
MPALDLLPKLTHYPLLQTLYTYANNPRAQLIQIAAEYGGSTVKVSPDFTMGVTNTTPEYLAKFPFKQVPAFESAAGNLADTFAIASLVGGSALRGENEMTRCQITQFMNTAETSLFPAACQILYPCWGLMPNNKNVIRLHPSYYISSWRLVFLGLGIGRQISSCNGLSRIPCLLVVCALTRSANTQEITNTLAGQLFQTLYTYANNPRAQLIQIAAEYGGSTVKVSPDFTMGVTNATPEYLAKFPFKQVRVVIVTFFMSVPAFESAAGNLADTFAIASLVGGSALRGENEMTRCQITQFMNTAETSLFPAACQILYPCWGLMPNNKNVSCNFVNLTITLPPANAQFDSYMSSLESYLTDKTYLVGEAVTLADLTVAMYLRDMYNMILDESARSKYTNVTRWFTTIINQDEVTRVVGTTALCTKPAQFDAKAFAANHPKPAKQEKAKPDQKPKQEAKPKPAAPVAEEPAAPKKETKKPFSDLAKPKMDMDTFKRMYWNEETADIMKYFDENFIDGEWSVWTATYKYNDELTVTHKTNNLVKGMYQRLETMKKHAFGLMYVFGEPNDQVITGIWLGRGDKLFFLEDDNWTTDIVHYDTVRLDMSKTENRALFEKWIAGGFDDWQGKPFEKDHIY